MDFVLEFADAYGLDYAYSKLFPATLSSQIPEAVVKGLGFSSSNTSIVDFMAKEATPRALDASVLLNKIFTEPITGSDVYGNTPVFFHTSLYTTASLLGRDNFIRQITSLFVIMTVFGWLLYLAVASFSYVFIFDKAIFNHPRYLKNQLSLEMHQALTAIPVMVALTIPWFLLELRGYSFLYWDVSSVSGGWWSILLQFPAFIMFTDFGIYLIHRWLHWPGVYKALHKPHHKWLVTTPFASHAFHPVDGYMQSLPYHIYPFVFPLHKMSYLLLFTFVNFWTVMIHDGEYVSNNPIVNGAACHTIHHLYFNYNYGQFTTLWDRLGNSYRKPEAELFDKSKKLNKMTWEKQIEKMEAIKDVVEGKDDDRVYASQQAK
ncbi:hypothetical protein WICPIJ_009771 [Wickerhamomyces pijperi]|uniref:Fatty acid hydroxylase domain-containing protein n=1 Tax=Wickerhamomyces pijperi TaxID=599730 RepID=A0A9P8TCH4_WICPI|nr:hypothetical protein WICPIJ_009771 [Wickerhamomyces pijperi]